MYTTKSQVYELSKPSSWALHISEAGRLMLPVGLSSSGKDTDSVLFID